MTLPFLLFGMGLASARDPDRDPQPAADGKICADRDAIRARSGVSCPIDSFKVLKATASKPPAGR